MVDLILRPSTLVEGKAFALQLRWHESLGETEYYTIGRVSEGLAEDIIRAGAPYWMLGEPAETGKDLKAEITALRTRISEMEAEFTASMREIDRMRSKLEKAQRWADARLAVVNLSVRDPEYMNRFNALAEAEDALSTTIRALAEGGGCFPQWRLEVDDGALIARWGSVSITVCSPTMTIYDSASGQPAEMVEIKHDMSFPWFDIPATDRKEGEP
jgi:hypothetical protein